MFKKSTHVIEAVDDFLHGLLTPAEAAHVRQHCEACPICEVALEEADKRFRAMQGMSTSEPSEELIQASLSRIDQYEQTSGKRRRWVIRGGFIAAAASIVLVGSLHLYYLSLSPTPYDLRIFGQNELMAGTHGSIRVQLTDREHASAIKNVPVDIELLPGGGGDFVRLASFTTDERGTGQPRLKLPDWKDGKYDLRITARTPSRPEVITRTIKLKRSWRLMLSTDKPVYQPGQTIRIRSLALRKPDLVPVAGEEATFSITDPKGNVIFKQREITSKYGIASADCPLAVEIIQGAYAVTCKIGDTESRTAVEVKKYVLPKFKIDAELDQPFYQPGQKVSGRIHSAYFFGKPLADAVVEVKVEATDIGTTVVRQITTRTDAKGKASFEFRLPEKMIGKPQNSGEARLAFTVTITDPAGQKQSKTVSRVVTASPIRIEVIPEPGDLVKGISNRIYLFTSYADGRPARTRISVSGVPQEVVTSPLGVAMIEVTPKTDEQALALRATDDHGLVERRQITLKCGQVTDDFLVRTDKAVYKGGETMQLTALGGGTEPVFIDLLKDGQTLLTASIDIRNGQGQYQLDLPPELFGTVEIQAYRFGAAGLAVRKSRVIYIEQARQLQIKATLDQAEYRPGHQAKLAIALLDDHGKPTPGAVSLAAVDEAVFSVLDQAPGMEQTFFTLEQELLKPVYAIYPWSPNLDTSASSDQRRQFHQALFARTAKTVIGKNETFQRFIDEGMISPRTLNVLEDENLEAVMERSNLSNELVSLIKGDPQHTLRATSYPAKQRQILAGKNAGSGRLKTSWMLLAACMGLGILIYCFVVFPKPVVTVLVLLCLLFLAASILLPSLSRARELSKRTAASANLRSLDMTVAMSASGTSVLLNNLREDTVGKETERKTLFSPRVREWFPETLLWRPELITDDQGRASLDIDLADSITTWRLTGSAVTGDGRLGAISSGIRVFQPFFVDPNLPIALTRGDEVAVPIVVYNYLEQPQTVELNVENAPWFEALGEAGQHIELQPGEVRSTSFRLRVLKVGHHQLQVTARGKGVADAIKREIEVIPDGTPVEQTFSGTLQQPAEISLNVPPEAIEGSVKAILKIYPSSFSQLVEGLDAVFQQPYGCFEQTSSTTYPNVLALDYLRRTNKTVPQVEAKARQYIHLGYQRLLGFEIAGGGFDWFGRPPANRTLTAYGLMEFQDMARVHDVDPELIKRTRQWLLTQRNSDGSWSPEAHGMHEDPTHGQYDDKGIALSTTAYVAWAIFQDPTTRAQASPTLNYLLAHRPDSIQDPYVLALVCNALKVIDPSGTEVGNYLEALDSLKQVSADGKQVWWQQAQNARTAFYGSGAGGGIETTALAALAMIGAGNHASDVRGALSWLVTQKDAQGTWHSTQATVLALKALLAGTGQPLGGQADRQIELAIANTPAQSIAIPADQSDVMKQLDLSDQIGVGNHRLTLADRSNADSIYQLVFQYHVPATEAKPSNREPLSIELAYDRTELMVNDRVSVTATVVNQLPTTAPMIILDLPIPAGFAIESTDFDVLVSAGTIARYQMNARSVVVYLLGLKPTTPLVLQYRLIANMPVRVTSPRARVYEYYDPSKQGFSRPQAIIVNPDNRS